MATMTLEQLTTQLQAAYGASLRSVVLYGSAATSDHVKERSDYNVLVLLDRFDPRDIAAVASTARAWADAGNPAPMTMTVDEWRSSSDIFPMEYADILERHRVLFGESPIDGITVAASDLRLQLEQEAMGKLLKLRQGALASGGDGKRQLELMRRSLSSVMIVFRSVLRLHGRKPSEDRLTVIGDVAGVTGIDATPFEQLVRDQRGEKALGAGDSGEVLARYLDAMQRLVSYLDRWAATEG